MSTKDELTSVVENILLQKLGEYPEYDSIDIINQEVSGLPDKHDLVIGVVDDENEFFIEVNVVEA